MESIRKECKLTSGDSITVSASPFSGIVVTVIEDEVQAVVAIDDDDVSALTNTFLGTYNAGDYQCSFAGGDRLMVQRLGSVLVKGYQGDKTAIVYLRVSAANEIAQWLQEYENEEEEDEPSGTLWSALSETYGTAVQDRAEEEDTAVQDETAAQAAARVAEWRLQDGALAALGCRYDDKATLYIRDGDDGDLGVHIFDQGKQGRTYLNYDQALELLVSVIGFLNAEEEFDGVLELQRKTVTYEEKVEPLFSSSVVLRKGKAD